MSVPEGAILPGSVVVNCVGSPTGSEQGLMRVNLEIAQRWGEAALAAGASHFIQLSSFSVYGRAERIDARTPEQPQSAYGRSKLAADRALMDLDGKGMPVTLLRIPMLFGKGRDKLSQLVSAVLKAGVVPMPSQPIERSMLSYAALGVAVVGLARRPERGVVNIADPTLFTYELLRDRVARATGRKVGRLWLPGIATAAVRSFAPNLHARLFASSKLEPSAALAFDIPADATLMATIDRLAVESL
jgi:UDP-glucose 4-epimerase